MIERWPSHHVRVVFYDWRHAEVLHHQQEQQRTCCKMGPKFPPVFHASQGRFSSWTSPKLCILRRKQTWVSIVNSWALILNCSSFWLLLAQGLFLNTTEPYYTRWTQPLGPGLCYVCLLLRCYIWHGPTVKPPTCFSSLSAPLGPWKQRETGRHGKADAISLRSPEFSTLLPKLDAKMEPLTVFRMKGDLDCWRPSWVFSLRIFPPFWSYLQVCNQSEYIITNYTWFILFEVSLIFHSKVLRASRWCARFGILVRP